MTSLEKFMSSDHDGVFYIGHASALSRINKKLILFDPIWNHRPYGDYWEFIPEQISCDSILDRIDVCVISHIHADHLCENILRRIKCPIYIMSGRPNLIIRLKSFMLRVIEFEPKIWTEINGLNFYFVPHAFNSIDSSCFVSSYRYCVYHGNDNFLSKELLDEIRSDINSIDVAMVPYAFIHWYPFLMEIPFEEKIKEIHRLNKQSLNQAQLFRETMKPRHTIPFGSSLFHVDNEFLNEHLSNPFDFDGSIPMDAGGYIVGDDVHIEINNYKIDLSLIEKKVRSAKLKVINHELIVNDVVIDLELLTVRIGGPSKDYTRFEFKKIEFKKWVSGEITFEQAIGTRQFTCKREPNLYNIKVFEFMNNFL